MFFKSFYKGTFRYFKVLQASHLQHFSLILLVLRQTNTGQYPSHLASLTRKRPGNGDSYIDWLDLFQQG